MDKGRVVLAFFLAPFMSALFIFIGATVLTRSAEGVWGFALFLVVAYPVMLLLGVPTHFALRGMKLKSLIPYALSGGLIGAIICLIVFSSSIAQNFSFKFDPNKSLEPALYATLLAAFLGGLTSSAFWFIARPDRAPSA